MKPERASDILLGTTRTKSEDAQIRCSGRRLQPAFHRSPAILFSLTIGMLGDVAVSKITGQSLSERLAETKSHLLFCARVFDSYFESRLDADLDPYMMLLASTTYYLAGAHQECRRLCFSLADPMS